VLQIEDLHDYGLIRLNGVTVERLDRRVMASSARISSSEHFTKLDILVENCGRVNYGPDLPFDRKGITRRVTLGARELRDWQIYPLPMTDITNLTFVRGTSAEPAFYRGTFHVESPGDSFFDVSDLGKGVLWINGRNAGSSNAPEAGVASTLCEPISRMISFTRGNQYGSVIRSASIGRPSRNHARFPW